MTQRERVLLAHAAGDWAEVAIVLGEAQNQPPEGMSDGSISQELWVAAKAMLNARRDFIEARRAYRRVWGFE